MFRSVWWKFDADQKKNLDWADLEVLFDTRIKGDYQALIKVCSLLSAIIVYLFIQ